MLRRLVPLAPLLLLALSAPGLCGPTSVDGSVEGTWDLAGSPYECSNTDLSVDAGRTLTIEPGVVVRFGTGRRLQVAGNLMASGTQALPITFTSTAASPAPGAWRQIQLLNSATAVLDHVAVQWAGQGSGVAAVQIGTTTSPSGPLDVSITNAAIASCPGFGVIISTDTVGVHTVTISNTSIHGAAKGGIDIQSAVVTDSLTITGNDLTGNAGPAVQVRGPALPVFNTTPSAFSGNLPADVLSLPPYHTLPYNVILHHDLTILPGTGGGPTVPLNVMLSVQPGVTMRFDAGQALNVNGSLAVAGTADNPATFTGVKPDRGYWRGIWLHAGATGDMSRARVTGAGAQGSAAILADGATLSVVDCELGGLSSHAVDFGNTDTQTRTLSVKRCSFYDVTTGDPTAPAAGVRIDLANPGDTAEVVGNTFTSVDRAISLAPGALPVFNTGPEAVIGNAPDDFVWVDGGNLPNGTGIWERLRATSDLSVSASATVTLKPGSGLRMGAGAACTVFGVLNIAGEPGRAAILDGAGGLAGAWRGLRFEPGSTGSLTSAIISDAGSASSANLNVNGATVTGVGCAFLKGTGPGVRLSGQVSVSLKRCLIMGNAATCVADTASGSRTLGGALVDGNDLISNGQLTDSAVNDWQEAGFNYWGAESGPFHPILNPLGLGGTVSDHIHFLPYSGNPLTLPVATLEPLAGPASGIIPIRGSAFSALLKSWTLEYGEGDPPAEYHLFAEGTTNINASVLANWDTAGLEAHRRHSVRLTVTDAVGRSVQYVVVTRSPYGDISGNGEVDLPDVVQAVRFARGKGTPTKGQLHTGDVRPVGVPDGAITLADATAILKTVAGLYGNLP